MKNFLQSKEWRDFQGSTSKRTFFLEEGNVSVSIVEHTLPIIGSYFYVPRGINWPKDTKKDFSKFFNKFINLAKEESVGWIRLDVNKQEELDLMVDQINCTIKKAPHDMQPRETFVIDINQEEEKLLAQMKAKTRYNVRLAEKKNVVVKEGREYFDDFWRLTKIMAKRQSIATHPREYYKKMLEIIPENVLKLYVAEYRGEIIAADLVVFYEKTAIYLHGASDENFRNVMAPYLLKWQEILEAKKQDCEKFDFGGISTNYQSNTNIQIINKWKGITRFKLGFSKNTEPVRFSGSYDIVIDNWKYFLYKTIQNLRRFFKF